VKLKAFFCVALFSVLTASAVPVSAELIIGNGNPSNTSAGSGGMSFGAHDGYGVRFQMGSKAATAISANVFMNNTSGSAATKSFRARIYSEATILDNPTPSPLTSATFDVSLGAGVKGWFDVGFGAGINLAASQSYVFAIEETVDDGNTQISWYEPASSPSYSSGIGASGLATPAHFVQKLDGANAYTNFTSSSNFGFQLHSVPEPSSVALMGMGLASVAAAARKRFKKKTATVVAPVESAV
jgi:hypothetical protein